MVNRGQFKKGLIPWNKGTKGLMPESYWKGKTFPKEMRIKLSESHKGNKTGFQMNHKINVGHHHTAETKIKIGDSHREEKSVNWNSDREALRRNKRNDGGYLEWVRKVKKRDNNSCQMRDENCFGYLFVHHIKRWAEYLELRYNINNGITLCRAHHPRTKAKEKELQPIFMAKVECSSV